MSVTVVIVSMAKPIGLTINSLVTDPQTSYPEVYGNQRQLLFTGGSGILKVNKAFERVCVLPPSGADTFNWNTGGVSGSETDTLANPIGSSNSFTTTGLNLLEINMAAGGSQSMAMGPGGANGFTGLGSNSMPLAGSSSAGGGG